MAISASDVKALREMTGAGMMDCKKVLTEAEGDVDRAVELLRERGLAKAGKRAGRDGHGSLAGLAVARRVAVAELVLDLRDEGRAVWSAGGGHLVTDLHVLV